MSVPTASWSIVSLGSVLKVKNGRSQKDIEAPSGRYPILATGGEIGRTDTPLYSKPSVLIGRKGTINRPQFQESPFWTVDTLFYTEVSARADARYLYYLCTTIDWMSLNEATGVPSLTGRRIESVEVLLPSLDEQQHISAVLKDADELIASLERLIAKKRSIKQGLMQELLTGRTRLPGFMADWPVRRLGELLSYEQPGRFLVLNTDYLQAGGIPVLTAGKTFVLGYTSESHGIYAELPVIIFDDFTTASKYVTFPFKAKSSAMKMLKARPGVNLRFVYERMQLIDFPIADHKRRWIAEFSKLEIPTPPLDEQEAVARVLADADAEIAILQQRLEATRAIKQGMMQELLTGRTRLVTESAA